MRKKRVPHLHRADRPLQLHEKKRELRLPLSRQEETSFLSRKGKQILTISSTCSKNGREHMLKKKGWSSPQPSNKEVWSTPWPLERTNSPLRHALRQDKMSMSLQVTLGIKRELLSQELLGLFASLHLLWKTEERARVGEGRRGKSKVGRKCKLRFPLLSKKDLIWT